MQADKLVSPYCITNGSSFRLKNFDPDDTGPLKSKEEAEELLKESVERLSQLQEKLYANDHWSLLLIFQAMDAAGKDGAIAHVMSGVNPQGCEVFSFKAPTATELKHDFLWRTTCALPERGRIGIFNRSYYEEVLVARVHPEILQSRNLDSSLITKNIWDERLEDIRNFEKYISRNGVIVRKFFLHISKEEQKKRFLSRLEVKKKNWKFSAADLREREHWGEYMRCYEEAIGATSTKAAPWYVVPSNHKWFTRLVVASAIIETLESLDLSYPKPTEEQLRELEQAKKELEKN